MTVVGSFDRVDLPVLLKKNAGHRFLLCSKLRPVFLEKFFETRACPRPTTSRQLSRSDTTRTYQSITYRGQRVVRGTGNPSQRFTWGTRIAVLTGLQSKSSSY